MIDRSQRFRLWSNPLGTYDLEIENETLFVDVPLPYKFKWIQILDSNEEEVSGKFYISKRCKHKLSIRKPGKYYFYLYGSDNGFNFEAYIGGKQIILELDNEGQWWFLLPLYTSWNIELIKNNKLDYVLSETLLYNPRTVKNKAMKLTAGCKNLHEKVRGIHDFVAGNLYYDYDSLSSGNTNRTIEQIVQTQRCVCQGYADLALVLLQSIGIHAENILCYAVENIYKNGWSKAINRTSELNHIITRVKLEERWLYMDVTWDSDNRYENGLYIKGDYVSHRYFDVTLPFLSATHRFFKKK